MNKESSEHLSSLMDGELSRESGLFITRRLSSDEDMCDTWERYHLIRDCIRQPGGKQVVTGLTSRLSVSLESESSPGVSRPGHNRWLKPVSGLAIAASVAMVAIMVSSPQPAELQETTATVSESSVQPFVSPNTAQLSPVSQAASFSPGQQSGSNRLNAYLLRHNQMAKTAGRQGFVSFVPIVATSVASTDDKDAENSKPVKTGSESEAAQNR